MLLKGSSHINSVFQACTSFIYITFGHVFTKYWSHCNSGFNFSTIYNLIRPCFFWQRLANVRLKLNLKLLSIFCQFKGVATFCLAIWIYLYFVRVRIRSPNPCLPFRAGCTKIWGVGFLRWQSSFRPVRSRYRRLCRRLSSRQVSAHGWPCSPASRPASSEYLHLNLN